MIFAGMIVRFPSNIPWNSIPKSPERIPIYKALIQSFEELIAENP